VEKEGKKDKKAVFRFLPKQKQRKGRKEEVIKMMKKKKETPSRARDFVRKQKPGGRASFAFNREPTKGKKVMEKRSREWWLQTKGRE